MLAWCLGALIATIYAALRPDDGLRNLLLLTAPLDFTDKTAGGFPTFSTPYDQFEFYREQTSPTTYGAIPVAPRPMPFRSPAWLPGGHLQTIWPYLLPRPAGRDQV